ncbi:unnamed protein product, partial [Polarella glacialis]
NLVAGNQAAALVLLPLVGAMVSVVGLRTMLVTTSLLPLAGALALVLGPALLPVEMDASWCWRPGLLCLALASTVAPVLPLVLVPANTRACGRAFGLLDSLFGLGQAASTIAFGALRRKGGFDLAHSSY